MSLLDEYAPFLATFGPSILPLALFLAALFLYLNKGKDGGAGRAAGFQPRDEDDYVFRDKAESPLAVAADDMYPEKDHEVDAPHVPYAPRRYEEDVMVSRSEEFYTLLNGRRSCRYFSNKPVPRQVVDNIIRAAGEGVLFI